MSYYQYRSYKRGFTLIEIIVVIAMIGVLTAIILPSLNDARANSRDKARIADLAEIQLALKLYAQQADGYPGDPTNKDTTSDVAVLRSGLDSYINPFVGGDVRDPRDNGTNEYFYAFDSDAECSASGQRVLYANQMELDSEQFRNFADVCTACTSGDCDFDEGAPTEGHVIIINR